MNLSSLPNLLTAARIVAVPLVVMLFYWGHPWSNPLAAIVFIYLTVAVAWFSLGASVTARSGESDARLSKEVAQLWGGRHVQLAPDAWYEVERLVTEMVEEKLFVT